MKSGATLLLCFAALFSITGCGSSVLPTASKVRLQGTVHGGQQPVTLSNINLYSIDVANGFVSQLNTPVVSDLNGSFSISEDYTCPSDSTPMVITATNGNPGLEASTNNTAIYLAAVLGDCSTLSASTYIDINEVTTVAGAAEYASIVTATTAPALEAAIDQAMMLANYATGTSPGAGQTSTDNGGTIPVDEINTLANITATCINSDGTNTSSSPCGEFFALTGSPTNTFTALTNLEGSPSSYNTESIYNLAPKDGPFEPILMAAPASWAIAVQ